MQSKADQSLTRRIRVLFLEDREKDTLLALTALRQHGYEPEWQRVETELEFKAQLDSSYDLILADYHLPQYDGLRALQWLKERQLDIPFIAFTGALGDELAAELIKQGATDYLLKDRPARLGPAVARALEEKQLREQRRAQAASLRESEALNRAILGSSLDSIIVIDHAGNIIEFNATAEKMFGFKRAEVLGREAAGLIIPAALRDAHRHGVKHAQAGDSGPLPGRRIEIAGLRQDGTEFPIELTITQINGSQPPIFTGFIRDITEQQRVARALKTAEAKFRRLVEQSLVGIYIIQDAQLIYVNPKMAELLGYSEKELTGMSLERIIYREDWPLARENLRRHFSEEVQSTQYTLRMERKDGGVIEAEVRCGHMEYSGKASIMGTMLDITERKKTEEKVHWLASFPEHNPNPIIELDLDTGVIHYANPATRLAFPDLTDQHPFLAGLAAAAQPLIEGRTQTVRREIPVGTSHYLQTLNYLPGTKRLRLYNSDITERRRAEDKIRNQLVELERWRDLTLGREKRILLLKGEINSLLRQSGQPPRYKNEANTEEIPPQQP